MIIGIGAIVAYGGTTPPTGSLLCDGSAISRATYSGLFAVIGIRFGAGDGATTFNLPNMPGAVTYVISYADDTTGSGAIVLAHAPALNSPTLGTASATSLAFSSAAGLIGTTTNDNAAAGSVGEYVASNLPWASRFNLATNAPANVASISLGAGDWDVRGAVAFEMATNTVIQEVSSSISLVSATRPGAVDDTQPETIVILPRSITGIGTEILPTATGRLSLASTTTVYLIGYAIFDTSTLTAYGSISARRMR